MKTLISPPTVAAPEIVVTPEWGSRFGIQIRGHHLIVDQTVRGGGEDAGPEPIELLGAALGGCIAYYVGQFCRARSLAADGLVVTVDQRLADAPRRVAAFAVKISLPSVFPERYLEAVERVVRSCPAYNTLAAGADVNVMVVHRSG